MGVSDAGAITRQMCEAAASAWLAGEPPNERTAAAAACQCLINQISPADRALMTAAEQPNRE